MDVNLFFLISNVKWFLDLLQANGTKKGLNKAKANISKLGTWHWLDLWLCLLEYLNCWIWPFNRSCFLFFMVYELYCFFWSVLSLRYWSCLLEEVQIFPHRLLSRSFQLEQLAVWPTWSLSPWTQLKSDCRWGSPSEHAPPVVRKYWAHLTPKKTPSY